MVLNRPATVQSDRPTVQSEGYEVSTDHYTEAVRLLDGAEDDPARATRAAAHAALALVLELRRATTAPVARAEATAPRAEVEVEAKLEAAAEWLRTYLLDHGRARKVEVMLAAVNARPPHNRRTVERAAAEVLGIEATGAGGRAGVTWCLPRARP